MMMQRTANENAAFTGSIFVCGPLHHHVLLSSIFGGRRSFQIRYAAHFLTWFGHDFPAGQFVSVRSFLIAAMT